MPAVWSENRDGSALLVGSLAVFALVDVFVALETMLLDSLLALVVGLYRLDTAAGVVLDDETA